MLSYRHHYHAGNFADVFKHVLLIRLLRALQRKDKPFCVLDTHAGAGCYDLSAAPAQKMGEHRRGIERLWGQSSLVEQGDYFADYLASVDSLNADGQLRWYPGSPRITRALLRPTDRLVALELHKTDHALLKTEFASDPQVAVHHADGYAVLKAFLPPKERRGLVFVDPAYERPDEFERLLTAVTVWQQRWPTGMLAIWYPILSRLPSAPFHQQLQTLGIPAILRAELGLYPNDVTLGMNGCGMLIINPPWRLDTLLAPLLAQLLKLLKQKAPGQIRLDWLTPPP